MRLEPWLTSSIHICLYTAPFLYTQTEIDSYNEFSLIQLPLLLGGRRKGFYFLTPKNTKIVLDVDLDVAYFANRIFNSKTWLCEIHWDSHSLLATKKKKQCRPLNGRWLLKMSHVFFYLAIRKGHGEKQNWKIKNLPNTTPSQLNLLPFESKGE